MKQTLKISSVLFAFISVFLISCKKDLVDNDHQVGSSKVTYYATITLNGNQYESVVVGGTYKEEGATAEAEDKSLDVTISGTVDVSQVGLYNITYSAVNSDGFAATATRTVAVIPSAEKPGTDISGTYSPVSSSTITATITKLAPGFYQTSNFYPSASTTIPCLFICSDGAKITIPLQSSPYGRVVGSSKVASTITSSGLLTYGISLLDQAASLQDRSFPWQRH